MLDVRSLGSARAAAFAAAVLLALSLLAPVAAADLDTLSERRKAVEEDLAEITAELEETSVRLHDLREERDQLREELRQRHADAEAAEELLADRALAAYVSSSNNPIGLLLGSERSAQALQRSRLLDGMGRREQALVEEATAAKVSYRQRRERLDVLIGEVEADEVRLAELQEGLDAAFREAHRREHELASRRNRQRRVSRSGQQGTYACPLGQPYHFRDTWGAPRSGGRRHRGVDLFAPLGADVYAITDGVLTRTSSSRLGGIGLYLRADDGNHYYYAHLQEVLPGYGSGRRVEAGEHVARNGATGNASVSAPHIHMEVRPGGGRQVNPYPFAAAACYG